MKLLLDVGNSRIKSGVVRADGLDEVVALPHAGDPAAVVAQLPEVQPQAIALANVTGADHEQRLCAALQTRYGCVPQVARTQPRCAGLQIAYADPARLGVDRWLMMLALWCEAPTAFGVAAAGTALTFDAVDAQGQHLGGYIAAGLTTHLQALLGATRFPTGTVDERYTAALGQDTESCVRQGAFLACLGALQLAARQYPTSRLVLSGGDATLFQPHLPGWVPRPHLVLEGLLAWLEQAPGR